MPFKQKFRAPKVTNKAKQDQSQQQSQQTQQQTQAQSLQSQVGTSTRTPSTSQQQRSSQSQAIGYDQATSVRAIHRLIGDITGSVFYLRSIIPDDNFIETARPIPQKVKPNGSLTAVSELPVRQFRNNYSSEASDVLGWLDFGILGVLDKKYLKSLIVVVYLKEETRHKAIEAYIFNFTYGDAPADVTEQMDNLQVGLQGQRATRNMRESFETSARRMMRKIWRQTGTMTCLPDQVTFDFKIFYTDDTPDDYEPIAFQEDESEIFLATHAADEVPITFDSEVTASTGFHNMTCQIVSIAHWLPHREEMEIDPIASEATIREAQRQAGREHQQEVEADDPGRDILWPLEQTIYGPMSSTVVDSSQIASVTVEPTAETGFTHPVGQLLPDGTIKAIPKLQLRWSDEGDEECLVRIHSSRPAHGTSTRKRPGFDEWNHTTQVETQQSQSQALRTDESMQIESSAAASSRYHDQEVEVEPLFLELDTEMAEEDALEEANNRDRTSPIKAPTKYLSSQSTESSDTGPQTPEDDEFDISNERELPLPKISKSIIRRKRSLSAAKSLTNLKGKSKGLTSIQISNAVASKVKSKPKKRVKSANAATTTTKEKVVKPKAAGTSNANGGLKANSTKNVMQKTTKTLGAKVVNRVAPKTMAQSLAASMQSPIESPDGMDLTQYRLSLDPASQSQTQQSSRFHPYNARPRQAYVGPSQQSQSPLEDLPVPKTHHRRIRSSRGVRGVDYSNYENVRPLAAIPEEVEGQ